MDIQPLSSYVGAAVGGAVKALIPGSPDILKDVVESAVANVTSMISSNIENSILGNDERHSFEEIFYTTVNTVIITASTSFLMSESKTMKKLSVGGDFGSFLHSAIEYVLPMSINGFYNSIISPIFSPRF